MTHKYLARGANYTNFIQLAEWLSEKETFSNKDRTFRGSDPRYYAGGVYGVSYGQLGSAEGTKDYAWFLDQGLRFETVDYVIYSYDTPIAWHDSVFGWIFPGVTYSKTTVRHQSAVEVALSTFAELVA